MDRADRAMTDATTAAGARALIDRSQYMTLATADTDGRPWVSPVWFAHEDYKKFLWVSRPDARHSLNIEARPAVALVVFDSTVAPRDAQAVYVEAEVEEVGAEALDRAVGAYSEKSLRSGLSAWSAADVTGAAPHRLYRARAVASFILAANDRRAPVSLPRRDR
jgi:nitroimidazol reductase NimA-like FMN-containing flavoprotein (pyridoxamine 5'-phosphate oxidase superfamily)